MDNSSLQHTHGILRFSSISIGIVLCSILVWFGVLHESSVKRIDQTLEQEIQKADALIHVMRTHNIPFSDITSETIQHVCSHQQSLVLEIRDINGNHYGVSGSRDSSLSALRGILLAAPITTRIHNTSYRAHGQIYADYSIFAAIPMPSVITILQEHYSDFSLLLVFLIIVLAAIGIWSYIRHHRPIQRLDQYLQTLILQPIGNELLKPPPSPKGDVDQLTQTITKIVERLHASRNQALQFSSYATHELRTPLSIIRSQLESSLTSRSKVKELRCVIASAYDEMLRLNRTVEDLLNLGTMQSGTLTLNYETISLPDFLNHFYDEALFLSRPKDITVVLKKGPLVFVKVDVLRLRQVFFNLLDNAIKNTPSGNRIRLSYTIKERNVVIVFADTGIGIAPDKLQKIFEPFYTHNQKGGNHQGAGLGLALVKWIIELHQGNIEVTSKLDEGTEFIISLPYERIIEER